VFCFVPQLLIVKNNQLIRTLFALALICDIHIAYRGNAIKSMNFFIFLEVAPMEVDESTIDSSALEVTLCYKP
jgi:hypothetical protein